MQNHSITIEDVLNDHSKDFNEIYSATLEPDNDSNNVEIQTQLRDSHYYSETELTDLLKQKKISDSTHLKILSLNIANLLSKLSSLKIMLQNRKHTLCAQHEALNESIHAACRTQHT